MLPRRRRTGSEGDSQSLLGTEQYRLGTSEAKKFGLINSSYPNNVSSEYYLDAGDNHIEDLIEPEPVMTARDRTSEFANTIQTLQGRNIARAVAVTDPRKSKVIQSHSEFLLIAKNVGKNIASTFAKLEKLTLLAKRKSLFDDRTAEIQELTYIIKNDLNSLNQQIAQLQNVSKSQKLTTNGKHLQSHSSNIVLALQSKLATMSTDFKQVLEVRTENLRNQKKRRDQFSRGGMPPPQASMEQASLLFQEQDHISIDFDNAPSTSRQGPQAQRQMQGMMYDETENYLVSRAETMQNIESTIVELGGIFQQLAHMVKEQEEMDCPFRIQDEKMHILSKNGEGYLTSGYCRAQSVLFGLVGLYKENTTFHRTVYLIN